MIMTTTTMMMIKKIVQLIFKKDRGKIAGAIFLFSCFLEKVKYQEHD